MKINVERLGILLDRGADAQAAARTARAALLDAEQALGADTAGNADQRAALEARAVRRRGEHAVAVARANVWARYSDGLRAVAQKGGVFL